MSRLLGKHPRIVAVLSVVAWTVTLALDDCSAGDGPATLSRSGLTDPQHLWNRMRSVMHVRMESQFEHDTIEFDLNALDPLNWSRIWFPDPVNYMVKGKPYQKAVAVLDEFLAQDPNQMEADPAQRAILQNDLWAVFDYVSEPNWTNPVTLQPMEKQYRVERLEMAVRLAKAIQRLALSNEQIGKLPDNYASALATQEYATQFDPTRPGQTFLPADLWDQEGPWVLLAEWANNPLAIRHTAFFRGRSTFFIFLRLPDGRAQTLEYIKTLRSWKPKSGEKLPPNGTAIPPQVPAQTQFAIVRQMTTINDKGELAPTRLTQSIQIRVLPDFERPGSGEQTFLAFRLRRGDLINGRAGLSVVRLDERERSDMQDLGQGVAEEVYRPIVQSCRHCHTSNGIMSMNSYLGNMDNVRHPAGVRTLTEDRPSRQTDATIEWKQDQFSWGLLSGLWHRFLPPEAAKIRE